MTFRVGDLIAHPLHGAGKIESMTKRKINGVERDYYVLKLPAGDMQVMVPVDTCMAVGVRPIIDSGEAERILNSIPEIEVSAETNWNKRYRDNMVKLKSGDLMEVASVVKGLMTRERQRGLSTGERKMLHSAKQILISEIVLSASYSYEEIEERLNTALVCS